MSDGQALSQSPPVDYKATLNLPQTDFKMKAGAATREPELEAFWESNQVYEKVLAAKDKGNRFLLHDGPPYLSSDKIHIGTALNKILKDIVTKYKSQRGYYSPYVPGYDGHGLPIENAVVKSIKGGRAAVTETELRKQCREFALKNLKGQETNFKRLGVWGNWAEPYVTIDGKFEATQIRLFAQMCDKGCVYKGLKPVYWCSSCETALADAEVEYADHTSESIFVRFPAGDTAPDSLPDTIKSGWPNTAFVIWTTTPWTIPANLGLCLNAAMTYVFLKTPAHGTLILAEALYEDFLAKTAIEGAEVIHRVTGDALEKLNARHPLYDRVSLTLLGDHVTADAGTGVVHTAPGHGHEDYLVGQQYGLGVLSPVNGKGVFTEEAGERFAGTHYKAGNGLVIEALNEAGALLGQSKLSHSYPHCWRCHNPVIYRATEQWFISIDSFREAALSEIKSVTWIPARGENRISSMVENRGDWCISRQRVWGVPIPVFYHGEARTPVISAEIIEHVAKRFEAETSDAWWAYSAEELLAGCLLPDGISANDLTKEMDIMDVWFDSGVTHTTVVSARAEEMGVNQESGKPLPVELYLEGSDQHRGWFQSALLTSVATNGKAPYKSVLTHGFVLDQNGRKMSKSLGNVVDPLTVINELGADVLRLWVASVDYTNDVRIGKETLSQLAEVYRKVRNTIRFILGNLAGFDAKRDLQPYDKLSMLDQYVLLRLQGVVEQLSKAFDTYEFHQYYQVLQNFCVTELSSLYFDVTKDVLYTAHPQDTSRLAVQTVLYHLLETLTPMLVPVMPHLAEDIWQNIPAEHKPTYGNAEPPLSALMLPWPEVKSEWQKNSLFTKDFLARLHGLKIGGNVALEEPRKAGYIGQSLETRLILCSEDSDDFSFLNELGTDFIANYLLVSSVQIQNNNQVSANYLCPPPTISPNYGFKSLNIAVYACEDEKCTRCWKRLSSVGQNAEHPQLCHTCVDCVSRL